MSNINISYLTSIISFFLVSIITLALTNIKVDSPEIIVLLAILCIHLSWIYVFEEDHQDGCLEQLFIINKLPIISIFKKIFIHWVIYGVPISCTSIISCIVFFDLIENIPNIFLTLLLGMLLMSFIGCMCASIMLGRQNSHIIIPIITTPLSVPTITLINQLLVYGFEINELTIAVILFTISTSVCVTYLGLRFSIG